MKFTNLLKFHGKFRELIPYGFKFQKLFANNYRQYCFEVVDYCEDIRVWQAHGGYIEINDWYDATKAIVEAVIKDDFKWHRYNSNICNSLGFTIVRETSQIIPYEREKHDHAFAFLSLEKAGKSEEEIGIALDTLHKTYRVARISQKMICAIKDMYSRGWIKI